MNNMDKAIYDALKNKTAMPPDPGEDAERPAPGASYYWDARTEGFDHDVATRVAAERMADALNSMQPILQYR